MERMGYLLLAVVAALYIVAMVVGMISALPYGLIGLVAIAGVGLLFIKVVKERLDSREDDYYSKNVDK